MAKIAESSYEATGRPVVVCDFSPPRSGHSNDLDEPPMADFLLVNYNPGRSARVNSALLAAYLRQQRGRETVFVAATRDMNRLALQSHLLGAQLLGLENVLVAQGDPLPPQDRGRIKGVYDYRPTELIAAIATMNLGMDFRERWLATPTDFCIGATVDLSRSWAKEAPLTHRKVESGAHFLLAQPIYEPREALQFQRFYADLAGEPLALPIFYGLQMLTPEGIAFGSPPPEMIVQLAAGRSGVELATELYDRFRQAGIHNIYLVAAITPGGGRNYADAQKLLDVIK